MKIFGILISLTLVFLSGTLFHVKYQSALVRQQLKDIAKKHAEIRQTICLLRAEWAYLNAPLRLAKLAQKHLTLRPLEQNQIVQETTQTLLLTKNIEKSS